MSYELLNNTILQRIDAGLSTPNSKLQTPNSNDPKVVAKQIETVFLNEFLRIMMEQTSFNKDKTVSTYMPFITSQIADYIAERGIGIGDFFEKSNELKEDHGSNTHIPPFSKGGVLTLN